MVRVMKERMKTKVPPECQYLECQSRRIPFVDNHDIGAGKFGFQKVRKPTVARVFDYVKTRKRLMKVRLRLRHRIISFASQVRDRPPVSLLVTANLMPKLHQLTGETAQKVRIA